MADNTKTIWSLPLILFTVTHLAIIFMTYGSLTAEMKSFNTSMTEVIGELKKTNESIQELKQSDIKMQAHQEYVDEKIKKLESKHP